MKITKTILYSFIFLQIVSCEVKSNKEMIDFATENFTKHEKDLEQIIKWIDIDTSNHSRFIELTYPKRDKIIIYHDSSKVILNEEKLSGFLVKFFKDFGIYRIQVFENGVSFESNIRNKRLDSYSYIYYRIPVHDPYYNYKVYSNKEIPKEVSGWLYKLKDNWYLESLTRYPDSVSTIDMDELFDTANRVK